MVWHGLTHFSLHVDALFALCVSNSKKNVIHLVNAATGMVSHCHPDIYTQMASHPDFQSFLYQC